MNFICNCQEKFATLLNSLEIYFLKVLKVLCNISYEVCLDLKLEFLRSDTEWKKIYRLNFLSCCNIGKFFTRRMIPIKMYLFFIIQERIYLFFQQYSSDKKSLLRKFYRNSIEKDIFSFKQKFLLRKKTFIRMSYI